MSDKQLWILGPAVFSVIGTFAGHLTTPSASLTGAFLGMLCGLGVTAFAPAGERPSE